MASEQQRDADRSLLRGVLGANNQGLLLTLGLSLVILVWGENHSFAASVTQIVNGTFEADASSLTEDDSFDSIAFGWNSSGSACVFNPSEGPAPQSFDFDQVGDMIAGWAAPGQFLSQDLTGDFSTLTSGITYTISARVGSRRDSSGSNYSIRLGDTNGTHRRRPNPDPAREHREYGSDRF